MPDREKAAMLGLAILAASEVPNFLAGMLPSLMTIQRFGAEEEDLRSLRRGELIGSVLALGVGFGATLVADSPWPFLATGVVLVIMLGAYEHAIRNPHPAATPINRQG
jgi:hypothetical protein